MKIKLLLLATIGCFTVANAQFTVKDRAGNELNNGDVIEYGSIDYADAEFEFFVTNDNPSEEIYTRIEVIEKQNSVTGTFEQLCYGLCYNDLEIGETVPPAVDPAFSIAVGETTGMGNHLFNNDAGNGTDNVEFKFAFRQYSDAAGTNEINEPLIFSYRYNPTLGVNELRKVKFAVQSTIVSNEIVMEIAEPVQLTMYNVLGKVVKQASFDAGRHTMNVSNLASQAYVLQITNKAGSVQTTKILKQ